MDLKHYRTDDLRLLHPAARAKFNDLATELKTAYMDKATRSMFLPFETYRHPLRQNWLKDSQKTSKASAFESAHQFGLAVDFVAFNLDTNKWSWDGNEDWEFLKTTAMKHGLTVPLAWDRVHVESPLWHTLWRELRLASRSNRMPSKGNLAELDAIWKDHERRSSSLG